jgi:hypothetical protein
MVKLPEGVAVVFENDSILNVLRIHLQKKDENLKFRVLDVIAQFAGFGDPVFEFIKKTDFLERIINELDIDDLLQQLNVIELLEKELSFFKTKVYKHVNFHFKLNCFFFFISEDVA